MTVSTVFAALLKVGDSPTAGSRVSTPCHNAATQMAEGVVQAFCKDTLRLAHRFDTIGHKSWRMFTTEERQQGAWCDMGGQYHVRRAGVRR